MIVRPVRRSIHFLLLALSLVLLIVACQNSSVEQSPASSDLTPAANDCRIVEHAMGETEVCGQPQEVVALTPHILDVILALGVQPTALAQYVNSQLQTYDNPTEQIPYLGQWITTKPVGLGNHGSPSLERLAQLQPDLILGEDWQEDKYSLLSQIAPTLLFSETKNPNQIQSWEQDIDGIAKALEREERAEELLTAHKQQIAQTRAALQPVLQAYPRVLVIASDLKATELESQPESTVGRLLQEIGFKLVRPEGFLDARAAISWEIVPQIETDLIIVMTWDNDLALNPENTMPEDTMQKQWAQNPLLKAMSAFQQDRVFFVDYYLWSGVSRGPLSDQLILEKLPQMLLPPVSEDK